MVFSFNTYRPKTSRGEYRPTFPRRIPSGPKYRESYPELCSPAFYRELNLFADNSSDFIGGLDDADVRLIEQLRHGALCPTNGNVSAFTQEHLDYWISPYAVEPGVTRRLGTGLIIPAEREERRRVRDQLEQERIIRRELSEQEKAMEAAELARAHAEWDIEQEAIRREREQRLKQTMQTDLEWEEAASGGKIEGSDVGSIAHPYYQRHQQEQREYRQVRPYSKTVRNLDSLVLPIRHYVPEWKRAEQARNDWEALADQRDVKRRQKAEAAEEARQIALYRAHEKAEAKTAEHPLHLTKREQSTEYQHHQREQAARCVLAQLERIEGQREYDESVAKLDRNRLMQADWLMEWNRLSAGTDYRTDDARPDLANVNLAWMRARTSHGVMQEMIAAQQAVPNSPGLVRVAENAKTNAEWTWDKLKTAWVVAERKLKQAVRERAGNKERAPHEWQPG